MQFKPANGCAHMDFSDFTISCLFLHLCKYSNTDENRYNWKPFTCKTLKQGTHLSGEGGSGQDKRRQEWGEEVSLWVKIK